MAGCQDVSRVLTPYVDGEVDPAARREVERHLEACQPCARRAAAEGAARRLVMVRSAALSVKAPEALRDRCEALAPRRRVLPWWRMASWRVAGLATASLVVVALAATIGYGIATGSQTLLAAELALDHMKCFALFEPRSTDADPAAVARQIEVDYGWRLTVPGSSKEEQLTLLGARRCYSTDGHVAHVMYRHGGQPVSLFMMPGTAREPASLSMLGHVARIWSRGDTTYVLVGGEGEPELRPVAEYFQAARF